MCMWMCVVYTMHLITKRLQDFAIQTSSWWMEWDVKGISLILVHDLELLMNAENRQNSQTREVLISV